MDEHRWKVNGRDAMADRAGIYYQTESDGRLEMILGGTISNEEILRLAGRVEELEKLAYLGEHLFPDLTWKGRAAELLADTQVFRRLEATQGAEIALLRRERALLIELEKARTRILASIFNTGGGCDADDVRQVGELLMAVEALHLEASGGVQRPPGVACACVLCRPEGAHQAPRKVTPEAKAMALVGAIWPNCPACGYPGHGETDRQKKYMGIYRPGEPCDKCGHVEPSGGEG